MSTGDPQAAESAQQPTIDDYGVIPPEFVERYPDADTVREALEMAEKAPSTTPLGERDRCPECGETRIRRKFSKIAEMPHEREERMKCWSCKSHFDSPAPPLIEIAPDPREIRNPMEPTPEELKLIRDALDMSRGDVVERSNWSYGPIRKLELGDPLQHPEAVRESVLAVYTREWVDRYGLPSIGDVTALPAPVPDALVWLLGGVADA